MDKKLEYVRRVRGTRSGIQLIKGTTVKYYTHTTRSQTTLQLVVDEQKQLIEEQHIKLAEYRERLAIQQAQTVTKKQAYKARLSMIESFMCASAGTSQIFNVIQENQPPQARVRSSVANRPCNSINWFIFWHLFIIIWISFSSLEDSYASLNSVRHAFMHFMLCLMSIHFAR